MLVNLCDHDFHIQYPDGHIETFEPSGLVARVQGKWENLGVVDGIPVMRFVPKEVTDMPVKVSGVTYIVSAFVARTIGKVRPDIVAPDMQRAVTVNGEPVIKAFVRYR